MTGFTVTVKRRPIGRADGDGGVRDVDLYLEYDGQPLGVDKASDNYWTSLAETATYGSSDDLWRMTLLDGGSPLDGGPPLAQMVQRSVFGVSLRAYLVAGGSNEALAAEVDAVSLEVHFECDG